MVVDNCLLVEDCIVVGVVVEVASMKFALFVLSAVAEEDDVMVAGLHYSKIGFAAVVNAADVVELALAEVAKAADEHAYYNYLTLQQQQQEEEAAVA